MRHKLLFIVGAGIGYVLGARAGRPAYEKLKAKATGAWEDPRVQKVKADAQEFVKENAPVVQEKVVAGTKAAVAGAQETYVKAAEAAKDISGKVAVTAKDVSEKVAETAKDVTDKVVTTAKDVSDNVAKTAKDVRDRVADHGEGVVDSVIIAAATARDRALEDLDSDDDEADEPDKVDKKK